MRLSDRTRRWFGIAFMVVGFGLIPWSIFLAVMLPSRHVQTHYYYLAWAGFDVALAAMLALTGVGLYRRAVWLQAVAASAATLLVCDAWFDVLSASRHGERLVALLFAIFAELPTAAVCAWIAYDAEAATARAIRVLGLGGTDEDAQKQEAA